MREIIRPFSAVPFLLGEQKAENFNAYKRASFCILTEENGKSIAYNTLTGRLVELNGVEAGFLNGESHAFSEGMSELVKGFFLVPENHDDIKLCDGVRLFATKAGEGFKAYHHFTVFPTMDCNARCFYCYENGAKKYAMSADTAKKTAEFIIRESKGEPVDITWYGGEPLMNACAIDIISSVLSDAGVEYTSTLATNASLVCDELIDIAVKLWKLEKAQVTLDGTCETYNKIKAYADGRENGFEDVLGNIGKMLDAGIKVNIRLNIDIHNISDIYELADLLAKRFAGKDGLNIYSALLFDCDGAKRPISDAVCRETLAKQVIELEDMLSDKGLLHPRKLRRNFAYCYCKADSADSIVITAEGKLVKCDFFTDEHFVGDVDSGIDCELLRAEKACFSRYADGYKYCVGCSAYPVCLRLAACPTSDAPCDAARRYITESRLVRSVRYAYKKATEGKNDI